MEYITDTEGRVWLTYPKYPWKTDDLVFVPEWKKEVCETKH